MLNPVQALELLEGRHEENGRQVRPPILLAEWNLIFLPGLYQWYEQYPVILIAAILSKADKKGWSGEGYQALLIAYDDAMYQAMGAAEEPYSELCLSSPDDEIKIKLEIASSSLAECVAEIACIRIAEDLVAVNEEFKFINVVRSCLRKMGKISVPSLEDLPRSAKFRVVTFSSAERCRDGSEKGHPTPHPMLLDAKNANTLTHLMYLSDVIEGLKHDTESTKVAKIIPCCLDLLPANSCCHSCQHCRLSYERPDLVSRDFEDQFEAANYDRALGLGLSSPYLLGKRIRILLEIN